MKKYDHSAIEKKWQKVWLKDKSFSASNTSKKKKWYSLIEFPYPSGDGLHVGHVRSNTAMDIISRKRRMEGFNVLYPIGYDAFGLPTENYAIKTGKQPALITQQNTDNFRKQMQNIGFSFDWSREINTTDPKYYKWTQWIFLQMFKQGLAYKKKMTINWCPKDKIGLANEEVVNGHCERCGTVVEKREKEQWMLAITKYADRLDTDLDTVDYLPQIKTQQRNWIGKSEGAEITFKIEFEGLQESGMIPVFTTRPDTLFGVSAFMLSPEHLWVTLALDENHKGVIKNADAVREYVKQAKAKTDIERKDGTKEKTGIKLEGVWAVNPANHEKIPMFVADYVLNDYGTGAVMSVPVHDERDFEFAQKYKLPLKPVLMHYHFDKKAPPREGKENTVREVVHVILRNIKNKTVLMEFLKGEEWGKDKPRNFIIGGIEEGETAMDAAVREIKEETGYKNIKFVQEIPFGSSATFFAAHKDVNRTVYVTYLVFDLIDEAKDEIIEDEYFTKDSHEIKWVPYAEVADTLTVIGNRFSWKYFYEGAYPFEGEGILTNSGQFNRMNSEEAKKKIVEFVKGKIVTTYKLRDWVFSRQRYWGEPIPLIHCEKCGYVAVPEKDLPVVLPKVKNYQPTDNGESPLANIKSWVNVKCPQCKGPATRETDTMPQWAGSSWYYLRYTDPKNTKKFADPKALKYWLGSPKHGEGGGVDWYNGGMEHTTLHVLYSRFWHKFLYDQKLVPTSEPYAKRTSHGLILAKNGEKMSKSKGNVVNPDEIVKTWGADSLRLYEMFMGPFDQAIPWSTENIIGVRRFLEKVWKLQEKVSKKATTENTKLASLLNKTIQKVSDDIEAMRFNTAVSAMMILVNEFEKQESISKSDFEVFLKLLSPFAPHISEELWAALGHKQSMALEPWPVADMSKIAVEEATIMIQINGKVRGQVTMPIDSTEQEVLSRARNEESVKKWLVGQGVGDTFKKVIYVKNRLINMVINIVE